MRISLIDFDPNLGTRLKDICAAIGVEASTYADVESWANAQALGSRAGGHEAGNGFSSAGTSSAQNGSTQGGYSSVGGTNGHGDMGGSATGLLNNPVGNGNGNGAGNGSPYESSSVVGGSAAPQVPVCTVFAGPLREALAGRNIEEVRELAGGTPLLAFSHQADADEVIAAMRRGLTDVLLTDQSPQLLADTLRQHVATGARQAQKAADTAQLKARLTRLTDAENEVLDAMLDGLANKQIAQSLQIGLRTVELRRSKIMRKMQAKSLAELVKFVCIARGIAGFAGTAETD
ncbi:MAG: LuxR C-terminal-related transcriptional regulator [Planctomycetota bacterium]